MEDTHLCRPVGPLLVAAVFDGHGGSYASKAVAQIIVPILERQRAYEDYLKLVEERQASENPHSHKAMQKEINMLEHALEDTFMEVDRELFLKVMEKEEQLEDFKKQGKKKQAKSLARILANDAGSTACVALISPHYVLCANAGDSRTVLQRHKGVEPLSTDHRPSLSKEAKRIRAAGGYVLGSRIEDDLAVSRGFGDYRFKEKEVTLHGTMRTERTPDHQKVSPIPEFSVVWRNGNDKFVLVGCDGIFECCSNDQVCDMTCKAIANHEDLKMACEQVIDECLKAGSKDNMSLILVDLGGCSLHA